MDHLGEQCLYSSFAKAFLLLTKPVSSDTDRLMIEKEIHMIFVLLRR